MIKQYAYTLLVGLVLSITSPHTLADNFYTYSSVTDPGYGEDFDTTDNMLDETDSISSIAVTETKVTEISGDAYKSSIDLTVNYSAGGLFDLDSSKSSTAWSIGSGNVVTEVTVYSNDDVGVIGVFVTTSSESAVTTSSESANKKYWGQTYENWESFVDSEVTYEIESGEELVGFHGFYDADNERILSLGIVTVRDDDISHIDYVKVDNENDALKIGVHFREDRFTGGYVCYALTRIEGLMETELDYNIYDTGGQYSKADAPHLAGWETLFENIDYNDPNTVYDDCREKGKIYKDNYLISIISHSGWMASTAGFVEFTIPSGHVALGGKSLSGGNGGAGNPVDDFPLEALAVTVKVIKVAGDTSDYQYYEQHKETLEYEADYEDNRKLVFPGDAGAPYSIPLAYTINSDTGKVACLADLTKNECLWVEPGYSAGEVPTSLAGVSNKHFIECSTDAEFIEKPNYSNVDPDTTSWCAPIDLHSRSWFSLEALKGEGWIVSANPQTGAIECLINEPKRCINLLKSTGTDYLGTDKIGDQQFLNMLLTTTKTTTFNSTKACSRVDYFWPISCPNDLQTQGEIDSATFSD